MSLEQLYNKSPIFFQTVMLNCKAAELYVERYGKKFRQLFEEFEKNQWLSEAELIEYQNEHLRSLIKHAYETVPYYSDVMRQQQLAPSDIRTVSDLSKLPILTKDIIRSNGDRLLSSAFKGKSLRHGHTTGTTGSPLNLCYDIKTCVVHHAADWRQKYWAGLKYGEAYASIQGRVIVPTSQKNPPFWRKNYINKQLFLSSFHLKAENIPYYFDKLSADGIRALEGYPSTVYILAMHLLKSGHTFPMKAVLTSSETLFSYQREAIEEAFSCKVFDFYGMAERAVFATECDQHNGHHLNSDYGITEFLDTNNGPAKPGALARIVATGIHNMAMPLIRYQTNDSSSLCGSPCSCGRGFPLMDAVATKNESIVTLPDGRLISPSVLTHPFKPMSNIAESQIIQERVDELTVKIVRKPSYSAEDETVLLQSFRDRLGPEVKIRLEYVQEIPQSSGGKFRWVISKISPRL